MQIHTPDHILDSIESVFLPFAAIGTIMKRHYRMNPGSSRQESPPMRSTADYPAGYARPPG